MAFDGVFAFQGKNHITASQLGRLVQGTAGDGRYVLPTQDRLQATMQTANKVVIGAGDLVMDGRYVTNEGGVELTVESGTSGYNRNDIVALRYSKDGSTGVESFEPEVIKGAPVTGTAADPAVDAGAISDGSSEALMPLWRIPIRGLAPGTPERIATVGKTLSEIGDSVSRRGKVSLTTHLNDNILQIAFDTPMTGDYVVIITNEFVKGSEAWGWTKVNSMVYAKTSAGFKVDIYSPSETYANIPMVLNWVAIPV